MILVGDCRDRMRELDAGSIQCVITSPPYFGLRDYGTGVWDGGDPACDHLHKTGGTGASTLGLASGGNDMSDDARRRSTERSYVAYADRCGKCGAGRIDRQIGLEPTPDEFITAMVEVFREVRRVLRDDGTVWLNLGDSYSRSAGDRNGNYGRAAAGLTMPGGGRDSRRNKYALIKDKDLLMIPAQVALALRADGWYLRSEIVWSKPNPMPESVTDRPTSAHEKLFLLAKSSRYYFDADAIREAWADDRNGAPGGHRPAERNRGGRTDGYTTPPLTWTAPEGRSGRNKRNVWEIATHPYREAHFATFPPKLVEPCVLAGSSPKACGECGAPWRRLVEVEYENPGNRTTNGPRSIAHKHTISAGYSQRLERHGRTTGWEPSCEHDDDTGRSIILDPFAGSGTTGVVCAWHGREFVGIELNPDYAELAERRIASEGRLGRNAHEPPTIIDGQLDLLGGAA